jgi:membrane protease YdiL (CAAX protease family)
MLRFPPSGGFGFRNYFLLLGTGEHIDGAPRNRRIGAGRIAKTKSQPYVFTEGTCGEGPVEQLRPLAGSQGSISIGACCILHLGKHSRVGGSAARRWAANMGGHMMKIRNWLLTESGVLWTSIILTIIVLMESVLAPWSPYFIIYAILAIAIPILLGTYTFGSFLGAMRKNWKILLTILFLVVFVDEVVFNRLYQWGLDHFGVGGNPFYSLNAATVVMIEAIASKFSITPDAAQMLYAFFVIIWAPIGEELYYRGYIQGVLRQTKGFGFAAIVSSIFFGIRHATHLFFLWPDVPWVAMASWVAGAFVFGLFMNYLYEKTKSLYLPMLVHFLVNIVELFFL